ncbi:MAG: heavy-metal-associated domain-containing protein [Bacteroidota bacterium]|nr:heavy-metal-associated domain-containing protein [Bacteroidota bacterium]MDP4234453.1 heavy-metal-associated domain-containing protein [Bacteroidota bacterium]MDP4243965.1 heavy-metal-associated domain-containing protein [Bacteroidota bacterium]MDP4288185.1 heavy-metal-associated domain-containing protein [Bacteroidota bacterium]
METLQFKTSINCAGCIASVTPHLNSVPSVKEWKVDTSTPARLLTVTGEQLSAAEIVKAVTEAGFEIQPVAA